MKKAVILLSGGLDSTTCLALAQKDYECYALSFDYGQKHVTELNAAQKIAQHFQVKQHIILPLPIGEFGGSALTDEHIAVPDYAGNHQIPSTYVPARNTVFLSLALGWAETLPAYDIFIGASSVDYSGYPDCRPEYFTAFQKMANLATKTSVEGKPIQIHTPLINLSKAETIQLGLSLDVDYSLTTSCYQVSPKGKACGRCDSCILREKGFSEAGLIDPKAA